MEVSNKIVQVAGLVAIMGGCAPHPPKEQPAVTIRVGESPVVQGLYMRYGGMPTERTFTIDWAKNSNTGFNLYYPSNVSRFCIEQTMFHILSVDPEKITLESGPCTQYTLNKNNLG